MSDQDKEQRTEEPTAKRLQEAREDGRVAKSTDLTFAVLLLVSAGLTLLLGGHVRDGFLRLLYTTAGSIEDPSALRAANLGTVCVQQTLSVLLPFLLVIAPVAAIATLSQIGIHFVPRAMRPRPEKMQPKLSPTTFVNGKSLIETATSALKFVFLAAAYYFAVSTELPGLLATHSLEAAASRAVWSVAKLLLYVGLVLLAIGLLDFALKRYQHMKDLRMTREEVKQEAKDSQGDPEVRARIKGRQKQLAMQRMVEDVPSASVVITNPTHYAVAIRYGAELAAPVVVAKGRDLVAKRIRELAKKARVPIVENPPLARALHESAEPGQEIPPTLYQAVAEVLAAVMKAERRAGRTG